MGNQPQKENSITLHLTEKEIILHYAYKLKLKIAYSPQFPHRMEGLRLWDSNVITARYVVINSASFAGKSVLEVASGVGLAGISVRKWSSATSITLSDLSNEVVSNIRKNCSKNSTDKIVAVRMNWDEYASFNKKYDIVLASDPFFHHCTPINFYHLLLSFLELGGRCILSAPLSKELDELLALLDKENFEYARVKLDNSEYLNSPLLNQVEGEEEFPQVSRGEISIFQISRIQGNFQPQIIKKEKTVKETIEPAKVTKEEKIEAIPKQAAPEEKTPQKRIEQIRQDHKPQIQLELQNPQQLQPDTQNIEGQKTDIANREGDNRHDNESKDEVRSMQGIKIEESDVVVEQIAEKVTGVLDQNVSSGQVEVSNESQSEGKQIEAKAASESEQNQQREIQPNVSQRTQQNVVSQLPNAELEPQEPEADSRKSEGDQDRGIQAKQEVTGSQQAENFCEQSNQVKEVEENESQQIQAAKKEDQRPVGVENDEKCQKQSLANGNQQQQDSRAYLQKQPTEKLEQEQPEFDGSESKQAEEIKTEAAECNEDGEESNLAKTEEGEEQKAQEGNKKGKNKKKKKRN